jgi:cytochrome c553
MDLRILSLLAACGLSLAASAQSPAVPAVVKSKCALCHGEKGETIGEDIPRLAGQNADYLAKELRDFQSGVRKSPMNRMARGLSADDIKAITGYYAAQAGAAPGPASELGTSVGRYLFQNGNSTTGIPACKSCHGEQAHGSATLPRLAGQHSAYLMRQIREFSQRKRTNDNEIMHTIVERITPQEAKAVAEYLASLP